MTGLYDIVMGASGMDDSGMGASGMDNSGMDGGETSFLFVGVT